MCREIYDTYKLSISTYYLSINIQGLQTLLRISHACLTIVATSQANESSSFPLTNIEVNTKWQIDIKSHS